MTDDYGDWSLVMCDWLVKCECRGRYPCTYLHEPQGRPRPRPAKANRPLRRCGKATEGVAHFCPEHIEFARRRGYDDTDPDALVVRRG